MLFMYYLDQWWIQKSDNWGCLTQSREKWQIIMSYFKRRGSRIRLQLTVDSVFAKTNARLLACVYVHSTLTFLLLILGPLGQSDAPSDWYSGGRGFGPRVPHHLSWNNFYGHSLPTRLSARWSYPAPPPHRNFADIPYLKELSFLHRIRDVCTL